MFWKLQHKFNVLTFIFLILPRLYWHLNLAINTGWMLQSDKKYSKSAFNVNHPKR